MFLGLVSLFFGMIAVLEGDKYDSGMNEQINEIWGTVDGIDGFY